MTSQARCIICNLKSQIKACEAALADCIANGGGPGPITLGVDDNFDGPDGPLAGRIPNIASAGFPWQTMIGTSANQVIQSNKAIFLPSGAGEWAYIGTGLANGTLLVSFSITNSSLASILFRAVDISNYWQVNIGTGDVRVYKVVAGVATEVKIASIPSVSGVVQSLYVELDDDHIKVTRAGMLIYEATDSYNVSVTKHGIGGYDAAGNPTAYEQFQMQEGLHAPPVVVLAATSKGTSAGGGHTDPIDTTGATLIVLNLAYYNAGSLTGVHDSQGNVYTPLDQHVDISTGVIQQLWYCENPLTGTAHQFQINGATIFAAVQAAAFGGDITVAHFDQQAGGVGSGLSITIGPVGQSGVYSLVVAGVGYSDNTPGPVSASSEFTVLGVTPYIFGAHFGGALAFKVSDSMILHSITWDIGAPMSGIAAGIATFNAT